MKFFTGFVLLLASIFASAQTKKETNNAKAILGTWVSVDDRKNSLAFTKIAEQEYYGGKLLSTLDYKIENDTLIAKDRSDGSIYRYSIMSLTKEYLTLMYLERGNLLKFKRKHRKE